MVSVLFDIFNRMTKAHYSMYVRNFATRTDLIDFLSEILMLFENLTKRKPYPNDWTQMILLQNKFQSVYFHIYLNCKKFIYFSIILKTLRLISNTLIWELAENFEYEVRISLKKNS